MLYLYPSLICLLSLVLSKSYGQVCSDGDITITGSSVPYAGRVEICDNNQWSLMRGSDWTLKNSLVVCRQLGYQDAWTYATNDNGYSNGSNTSMCRTSPRCNGTEERLFECKDGVGFFQANCTTTAASVVCRQQSNTRDVRLVGDVDDTAGVIQMYYDDQWTSLCYDTNTSVELANATCQQLGWNYTIMPWSSENRGPCIPCRHQNDTFDCGMPNQTMAGHHLIVNCSRYNEKNWAVTLSDGDRTGAPVVVHNGRRGRICESEYRNNQQVQSAICQKLGFNSYELEIKNSSTRQLPILIGGRFIDMSELENANCTPINISNLNACPPFGYINQSYCNGTIDAVLTCRDVAEEHGFGIGAIVGIIIGTLLVLLFLSPFIWSCLKACYKTQIKPWITTADRTSTHPTATTNPVSRASDSKANNSVVLSTSEAEPSVFETEKKHRDPPDYNETKYNDATL